MKSIIHRADSRGHADHGWLDTYHTFSFANYYDPERVHFGALRVLNDDIVIGGKGFGAHPHDNMEIISIPLYGELEHRDNTGKQGVIRTNDVQIMSAGTGIMHAEKNASNTDPVNFLQIWIFPKEENIQPRYEQKTFDPAKRENRLQLVVAPDDSTAVWINQNAWLSLGKLVKDKTIDYTLHLPGNGLYIFVLSGSLEINGERLERRDGMGLEAISSVPVKAVEDAEFLLIEVPV
jgi:quercetin 2,3-dioxygenase